MAAESLQHRDTPLFLEYLQLLHDAGGDDMLVIKPPLDAGDALLVIDMQNDFIPSNDIKTGGRFAVAEGDLIVPLCVDLISQTMMAGGHVYATRDYHPVDHASFSTEGGPFPPHCVQGTSGSKLHPSIARAMAEAVCADDARAKVAFKGMHEDIDSFGALPYMDGGEGRITKRRGKLCTEAYTGCAAAPWTGCLFLKCSALRFDGDIDVNAPPDMLAVHHGSRPIHRGTERPRCVQNMVSELRDSGARRILLCGLALDFCVCDTALNASAAGFDEVVIVLDAARPAHIDGIGSFGSGFLSDPSEFATKLRNAGVTFTSTMCLTGRRIPLPPPVPAARLHGDFPQALGPFGLTRVTNLDIKMVPNSVTFQVRFRGSMRPLGEYMKEGFASSLSAVTLENEGRSSANIPAAAKSFSWAYPLPGMNTVDARTRSLFLSSRQDPNWHFIAYGGFLYFSEEGYILAANAVGPGHGLLFGPPEPWRSEYTATLLKDHRFQPVTLTDLLHAGARYFAWIHAGEMLDGPDGPWTPTTHGAFVYLFDNDDPIFFQVVP